MYYRSTPLRIKYKVLIFAKSTFTVAFTFAAHAVVIFWISVSSKPSNKVLNSGKLERKEQMQWPKSNATIK